LVKELCVIEKENIEVKSPVIDVSTKKKRATEKAMYTRNMSKMDNLIHLIKNSKTKEALYSLMYDLILSLEGMSLLPGFSYTNKKHKSTPVGNAEKISSVRFCQ